MIGLENLKKLSLRNNTITFTIEGHKCKLKLIFFTCTCIIGNSNQELARIDLSRLVVIVKLEYPFALWRWIHLQDLTKLGVVNKSTLVFVCSLKAFVGFLDRLRFEIVIFGELLECRLFSIACLHHILSRRHHYRPDVPLSPPTPYPTGGFFPPATIA